MQYVSNIRLYEYCGIDVADTASLNKRKMRRILMAEFSMAPDSIIRIDGFEYNRNDILIEVDSPDLEKRISYHQRVRESFFLTELLEKNSFNTEMGGVELLDDPDFVDFLSPYLVHSLAYILRSKLNEQDFLKVSSVMYYANTIDISHKYKAYDPIRNYLGDAIEQLNRLNSNNVDDAADWLEIWRHLPWEYMINQLPENMSYLKTDFVQALMSFMLRVTYVGFIKIYTLYDIACHLINIKGLSPRIHEKVKTRYELYLAIYETAKSDPGIYYNYDLPPVKEKKIYLEQDKINPQEVSKLWKYLIGGFFVTVLLLFFLSKSCVNTPENKNNPESRFEPKSKGLIYVKRFGL